jgi:hypothetical protein
MKQNMNDLGLLMIKLENNQRNSRILDTAKKIYENNPYSQVCIFNSYSELIDNKNIPILHISDSKFFNGNLLVLDIPSLILSKNFPNIQNRFFYAENTPWTESYEDYSYWESIFKHPNLKIITKNQTLSDIYEICWTKPLGISENLDYDDIKHFL